MNSFLEILTEMSSRSDNMEVIYPEEFETLIDACEISLNKEEIKSLISLAYSCGRSSGFKDSDELIEAGNKLINELKKHINLLRFQLNKGK